MQEATRLGLVTKGAVQAAVRTGRLPATKGADGCWRFDPADVQLAFVNGGEAQQTENASARIARYLERRRIITFGYRRLVATSSDGSAIKVQLEDEPAASWFRQADIISHDAAARTITSRLGIREAARPARVPITEVEGRGPGAAAWFSVWIFSDRHCYRQIAEGCASVPAGRLTYDEHGNAYLGITALKRLVVDEIARHAGARPAVWVAIGDYVWQWSRPAGG